MPVHFRDCDTFQAKMLQLDYEFHTFFTDVKEIRVCILNLYMHNTV